jgi:FKBP-type peptidyl-prolyl cis-trans isomerase FkpA
MQRMKMGMRGAAASVLILAMGTSGVALSQQPAAPAAAKETATLNSPKQKLGYAIGLDVAKSFTPIADEIDVAALRTAVERSFEGLQPQITQEQAKATDAALRQVVMARSGQQVPGMAPGSAAEGRPRQGVADDRFLLGGPVAGAAEGRHRCRLAV